MTMMRTTTQPPRLAGPRRGLAAPTTGAGTPGGLTPKELLGVIRRRKWLILSIWTACVTLAVVATLLWWLYLPLYTAAALLEVQPPESVLAQARAAMYPKDVIERHKRNLASLVKQFRVLDNALKDRRVIRTKWYTKHLKKNIVHELDDAIEVSTVPETSFIRLSMTGLYKEELPDIVNAVAESFVRHVGRRQREEVGQDIEKLQRQKDSLSARLKQINTDLGAARGGSDVAGMEKRRNVVSLELQMLTRQVSEAQIALAQAEANWKAHQKALNEGTLANGPEVQRALEMNPEYRGLMLRLAELKTRLHNVERRFGPQHLVYKSVQGMIESLEQQIAQRKKEIVKNAIDSVTQLRLLELESARAQVADLMQRRNEVRRRAQDLERTLARIESLQREAELVEESLRKINDRLLELQTGIREATAGGAGGGRGREELVAAGTVILRYPAELPRDISWPKWSVNMALGVLVGLLLGFGMAFLLEFTDTSIRNPSDIVRRMDLPLLGVVPHGDDLEEEVEDFRRVILEAPRSPAAEAFRQIRTNLLYSGPVQQRRSMLVTSPGPEDGRTTVVLNLAVAIAQAGHRVLVVDANFRQPAIADLFPGTHEAGLSSALVGQAQWRDVVSSTEVPNLEVIASGPLPPNPAELLGSDIMRQLVSEMAAEYDQVIFDGSPAMVVSDACVLATQVDAVVLVVRAHQNSIGIALRTAEQLRRIGAHVLGVVLQAVRTTAGGYLRKNYQTFYEYHQRALP